MKRKNTADEKPKDEKDFINGAIVDKNVWSEKTDQKKGVTLSLYGNLWKDFQMHMMSKDKKPSDVFNEIMKKELGYK